ncbi:hypothetical protein IEO21_05604 [Rhodonia placenta]|uniref:Actin-like ATPase domain-containing protein n=1 Tax=Rhodonia placenta TaxID=104341 RepID=A0A8H7U251_9APHY|nr:hypothetical protein IEO21_05604 [Postia placenta]
MSGTSFRDSLIVIIDTGRSSVRAGLGLHDLLKPPSIEILARVGLPRSLATSSIDESAPDVDTQEGSSTSKPRSPPSVQNAKTTDYLVGTQLDDALAAGQDLAIYWPFATGDISDWVQAEALWKYCLFTALHLRRLQMESPVLLTLPSGFSRDAYERVCQLFFERLNVAAFGVLERPTTQFYAALTASSQLSGVIVDVDLEWTDITPIYDGFVLGGARTSVNVGMDDCKRYLAGLLRSNQTVMAALAEPGEGAPPPPADDAAQQAALEEFALQLWTEDHIKVLTEGEAGAAREADELDANGDINIAAIVVAGREKAVIESGMRKKAARGNAAEQAKAREIEAKDLVEVQWRGKTVTVGKERHRFCEPLFDLAARGRKGKGKAKVPDLPLQVALGEAVSRAEVDQRSYMWQGLFVTGEITKHVRGLGAALQTRLNAYMVFSADQLNEVQPRVIRTLKIPEYFAEYREKGDGLASFLGASIVAKIAFNDSAGKNFVSKTDYASQGPRAVLGMSPSLL